MGVGDDPGTLLGRQRGAMLEELACPHLSPPTLFASKCIISYRWVCVPLPGLHFLEGNSPQPVMVSALQSQRPRSAWYLNLEKVLNSYATDRSASSSEGRILGYHTPGSHSSFFQSLQPCLRARSLDSGPHCPPLHRGQRSLVR